MTDIHGVYREMGELTATVRELNHTVRDAAQKVEAVAVIASTVERLVTDFEGLRRDVDGLKQAEDRRKGAVGLVEWLARHWPFAVLLTGLTLAWAWITGKPTP